MKKFVIIISLVIALLLALDLAYFRMGWFVDLQPQKAVTTLTKAEGNQLWLRGKGGYEPFEIKGVNLGSGKPGEWATDFAIDKETYLRWFHQMQEMGANTVRVYTVQQDTFYNAFYEYNKDNDHPLWLIHGVWVNDYIDPFPKSIANNIGKKGLLSFFRKNLAGLRCYLFDFTNRSRPSFVFLLE